LWKSSSRAIEVGRFGWAGVGYILNFGGRVGVGVGGGFWGGGNEHKGAAGVIVSVRFFCIFFEFFYLHFGACFYKLLVSQY